MARASIKGMFEEDHLVSAPADKAQSAGPELTALEVASRLMAERRSRGQWLNGALFSDPAWDIMINLYVAQVRHGGCTLRRLLVGSSIPPETATRWVAILESEGLVTSAPSTDGFGPKLRLTDQGYGSLNCHLAQVAASWGYRISG